MKLPKIKVNKVNASDLLKPLALVALYVLNKEDDEKMQEYVIDFLFEAVYVIGGMEMAEELKNAIEKELDEYYIYELKRKKEAAQ